MSTRSATLAILMVIVLTALTGCGLDLFEPRVASPFSHQRVTASELAVEQSRYEADQKAKDAHETAEAQSRLRHLKSDAELNATKITSENTVALAELKAKTDTGVQDVIDTLAAAQKARDAQAIAMRDSFDLAEQNLVKQAEQRQAAWGFIKQIPGVAAIPGFGSIDGLVQTLVLGGVAGGGVALGRRGKKALKTKLSTTQLGAERIVDSIDALKLKAPEVAAAFKTHAGFLKDYQGVIGAQLVEQLQKSDPHVTAADVHAAA